MKKIKLFFTAAVLLACSVAAFAQNVTVKGTVKDEAGEPIVGANVVLQGSSTVYALTDFAGAFSLSVPSDGKLDVNCMGYQSAVVPVNGRSVLSIVLSDDAQLLDETIVVAYGTATRSSFTGSASTVKAETLEKRQASNITNTLGGAVSGVQTMSGNGQPGVGSTVRIRGFGSMSSGISMAPLYVVDGIPYDGDISAINTQDIESMTVLKDAASAALYGSRGANGVILITTKRGKTSEAVVNFDARVGVNSRAVKNYNVMTQTGTYMEQLYQSWYNAALYNLKYEAADAARYAAGRVPGLTGYTIYTVPRGQNLFGANGKLNPNAALGYFDGEYYYTPDNWAAETFHNQIRQEYNLSVSGGSDKINYYVSAAYLADGGVILGSGFDRLSFRANVDYQAKKWLKVGTNVGFANYTSRYPSEQTTTSSSGNAFFIANFIAPVYPMYVRSLDENGQPFIVTDNGNKIFDWGDGYSTPNTRNWMSISNPLGDLSYQTEEYKTDLLNAKGYVSLMPLKGLSVTGTVSAMIDNTRYNSAGSSLYGQSAAYGGTVYQDQTRYEGVTEQLLGNYHFSLGERHNFDLTAAYENSTYGFWEVWASGQNLYRDDVPFVDNSIDQKRGGGEAGSLSHSKWLARVNYDDNNTIFLSASFCREGSSRFAPGHRWGNFWSASAAWVINKELWFNASWVDLLKLKVSFGQQGNDNLNNWYPYLDQFKMTGADGVFSDSNLYYKGNPDLTWETTNAFNTGVDFDFWNGKLSGGLEYFNRTSSNLLYDMPVAGSNGYTSIPVNVGSIRNSGIELELNSTPVRTKNIQWDLFANITYLNNKIVSLAPELEGELIDGSYIYREGESRYQMYLVKYAGVDRETGLAQYWAKDADTNEEYKTDDWAKANSTNRSATGSILAPFFGGFGTSVSAYGFDLSVQFSYQFGGRLYDNGYVNLMHNGGTSYAGQNWHMDILNAWTPENPDSDIPRVCATDSYTTTLSDRWLISSNYLSLNNVTFGYTIPQKYSRKIGAEQLRFYVAGDNLAVFSARTGLDPRQGVATATTALYTALRTVSGGVKLTF